MKPSVNNRFTRACISTLLCISMVSVTFAAEKQDKNKADTFRYDMPAITPPAHHPRLLITPTFLPTLKDRIASDELCQQAWKNICDGAAQVDKAKLPADNMYSQNTLNAVIAQAMRYVVDGDAFMGNNAVTQIIDNVNRVEFADRQDVTRDRGATIFAASLVYDWCYPLLTDDQKQTIITQIKKIASRMEIKYPPYNQGAVTGHAGEAQLLRDLLSAGIAVFDEDPSVYHHSAGRFFEEFIKVRNFFYPSHRHHQGIGYGPYRFHWEIYSAWLFKRMSNVDLYVPDQGKVPYHWIYATCPNDTALIDGDTNAGGKPYNIFDALLQVSNYYKDPYLQAESFRRGVTRFARSNPIEFLLFYDPSVKPGDMTELPTTKFFAEPLGGMIARTGWTMGRDSDVAVVEMKGAGHQFNNHAHLDAGAFQIYYRGHLAIDTGAYPKYGTPFDWGFNKRSISHNVMLAYDPDEKFDKGGNDGGQHFPYAGKEMATLELLKEHGKSGSIISHDFGPNTVKPLYSYLRSDLTPAYRDKMKSYQRHFVMLNLDDSNRPAALLVYDRMQTTKPDTRKIWLLQTLAKPVEQSEQLIVDAAQDNDTGRMVLKTLLPQADQRIMRCVGGPDANNPVFDETYPILINKHGSVSPFNAGYRTEIEDTQKHERSTFLNVMQIMDRSVEEVLPMQTLYLTHMTGVSIADWQVYFPNSDLFVDQTLPIEVLPEHNKVLLTGMWSGAWYLLRKDQPAGTTTFVVKDDTHSLYLQLEPGKYTLTPASSAMKAKFISEPVPDYSDVVPVNTGIKQGPRAIIDGKRVELSELRFEDNTCLVDALPVLEAMGAKTSFDSQQLTVMYNHSKLVCENGKAVCMIDGVTLELDDVIRWDGKVVMLPLELIAGFTQYKPKAQSIGNAVYLDSYPKKRSAYPPYVRVRTSHPNAGHPAFDAVDGDVSTYFASQGTGVQLAMDLGRVTPIKAMDIVWHQSDKRQAIFSIDVSVDGKQWKQVFDGKSSGATPHGKPETFAFDTQNARYVRITSNGNTQNAWNSICEAIVVPTGK